MSIAKNKLIQSTFSRGKRTIIFKKGNYKKTFVGNKNVLPRRLYRTLPDEIMDNPERFTKGMDLSQITDKQSFDKQVSEARREMQTPKQKRAYEIWTAKAKDVLYGTSLIQKKRFDNIKTALKNRTRNNTVNLPKSGRNVKGLSYDEESYMRIVGYMRGTKKIEFFQRVNLFTGRVMKRG